MLRRGQECPSEARPGGGVSPDAVTAGGAKHLGELSAMVAAGRAVMAYLVQRGDREHSRWREMSIRLFAAFGKAVADGVETICYSCRLNLDGITLDQPMPIRL